jgi:nucleoside-diphosphate-sugar epimerase
VFINEDPYPHDVQKRIPDTTKARKQLNFEANTNIDQVLDEVIPWVKEAIQLNMI